MAYMGPAFNTFDVNFNFSDLVLDAGDIAENGDLLQYDLANAQWLTVSNLTIPGDLIVNGTTTTVNSTTVTIDDPIFTLGGDVAPTVTDALDRGIEFRWHDGVSAKTGFFGFDNGTGSFTYIPDATNTNEVFSGTPGSVNFYDANFSGNTAIKLPVGGTADRPTAQQGHMRYNTDLNQFEGYDGSSWAGLGGIIDADQDTYIDAEATADDDTLRFYTGGVERMTIDGTGNINFNGGLELGLQATQTGEVTTTATTQIALDSWSITAYRTAKYMLQAIDTVSSEYHVSELMVIHDGTTAYATEYGTIHTGANPLASYDVDVNSNNVRLLATPASTNNTNFKFSRNALTPEPTFALASSSGSINEGDSVTFTLTTTQVSNGTLVPYTVTGIQSADLSSGSLTGNFTVNNNTATSAFTLSADATTEGSETLTLALDNGQASSAVTIGDTSLDPTYTLSADNTTINEGASVVITLTTTDVPDATNVAYTVTGVDANDLSAGSLTGNFTISNNTATATFTLSEDTTTEGDETLTLTLDNGSGNIAITITDSSTAPVSGGSGTVTAALDSTLTNPDPDSISAGDRYGYSVGVHGDYAIVGAWGEGDGVTDESGKAYIHNVSDGSVAYTLNNPNAYSTEGGDRFGWAVDIASNYAIVGAYQEDDANGTTSGKAYIFNVSNGSLAYTLNNPAAGAESQYGSSDDHFGYRVAISDTYAIVSAPQEWDVGQASSLRASGKAYIYNLSNGSLAYTLNNPNPYGTTDYDRFGERVAISDSYAIVGTPTEDDAGGNSSGKAYIYDLSNGSLLYTLNNPNAYGTSAGDYFGYGVGINENYAVVGAYQEGDDSGTVSGKAYIYDLSNGSLLHTIDNPNPSGTSQSDQFGANVGVSDTYAFISASGEEVGSTSNAGRCYVYNLSDGTLITTIDNPDLVNYNPFGDKDISITDTHAIVGAPYLSSDAGTAYIYTLTASSGSGGTGIAWGGERGIVAGGFNDSSNFINNIDYFDITTPGNATDFGDLTIARYAGAAMSSGTRVVFAAGTGSGGAPSAYKNTIDYITSATTGNATDFGDMDNGYGSGVGGTSDSTRGVTAGGFRYSGSSSYNNMDYITIATASNSTTFGNLVYNNNSKRAMGTDGTIGVIASGGHTNATGGKTDEIEYITIQTAGNATLSSNTLSDAWQNVQSLPGDSTHVLLAGGRSVNGAYSNGWTDKVEQITVATQATSANFGSLNVYGGMAAAGGDGTYAFFAGRESSSNVNDFSGQHINGRHNTIERMTIATGGTATDHGDLNSYVEAAMGSSGGAS